MCVCFTRLHWNDKQGQSGVAHKHTEMPTPSINCGFEVMPGTALSHSLKWWYHCCITDYCKIYCFSRAALRWNPLNPTSVKVVVRHPHANWCTKVPQKDCKTTHSSFYRLSTRVGACQRSPQSSDKLLCTNRCSEITVNWPTQCRAEWKHVIH